MSGYRGTAYLFGRRTGIDVAFTTRTGKNNRFTDGKLERFGPSGLDAVKPEKLIALLDNAVAEIFEEALYDELMETEKTEREIFRDDMKYYVDNEL